MKEKTVTSLVFAILLVTVSTLNATVDVTQSVSFERLDSRGSNQLLEYSISSEPPPQEWNRTYGGTNADRAHSIVETSDGGYAIAGDTDSYGSGSYDISAVKVDSYGNVQWNRTYGGTNADRAHSIVETSDGGYAIAGATSSSGAGNYSFWLVKTDSSGVVQWNKTYGGTDNDIAYAITQTSDGGYAIAGNSYGAGGYDFFLVKTDATGNMLWNKTYGGANNDIARSLVQTDDGGYAMAGETKSQGAGYGDFWLVKTDASGNVLWNKTYGGTDNDIAYAITQTSDGGYAIAGDTESYGAGAYDFFLVKTDSSGIVQWNKTYGGANHDIAYSLVQTINGGYAIAGDTESYGAGAYDFFLVKTDATGNMLWNKTYGGASSDIARSLVQTSDAGYAITGYTASYGAGSDDFWLIKVTAEDGAEIHDVAVTNVAPSKTVVGQGSGLSINVTVTNQGDYSETFNVTAYADTTAIGTETVTLGTGSSATVAFTWDTLTIPYGSYTLSAVADTVPSETDTDDNTHIDGTVFVTITGDVNGDGTVDASDMFHLSKAYGCTSGDANWNPNCDCNNDDKVDKSDLTDLNKNYGKTI